MRIKSGDLSNDLFQFRGSRISEEMLSLCQTYTVHVCPNAKPVLYEESEEMT